MDIVIQTQQYSNINHDAARYIATPQAYSSELLCHKIGGGPFILRADGPDVARNSRGMDGEGKDAILDFSG